MQQKSESVEAETRADAIPRPVPVEDGTRGDGRRPGRQRWVQLAAVALVAAMVGAGAGVGGFLVTDRSPTPRSTLSMSDLRSGPDVPALLTRVLPTVVSIEIRRASGAQGAGSGVIISANGQVLTNAHVAEDATSITVNRYGTSRELPARLIGASPGEDLALLQIENASGLPTASLGDSSATAVGAPVVAVGNALGLSAGTPTVTQGIVSAQGRSITSQQGDREVTLEGMLQTDAAINPGNSGGPLFDFGGNVIGINTAIAGVSEGIGFAIPIDHVKDVLGDLRGGGTNSTPGPFVGVVGVGLDAAIRAAYGLPPMSGVLVTAIVADSPAARGGLVPGDVIVEVGGTSVNDGASFAKVIASFRSGQSVQLQIVRAGTTTTLQVTLTDAHLSVG